MSINHETNDKGDIERKARLESSIARWEESLGQLEVAISKAQEQAVKNLKQYQRIETKLESFTSLASLTWIAEQKDTVRHHRSARMRETALANLQAHVTQREQAQTELKALAGTIADNEAQIRSMQSKYSALEWKITSARSRA